MRARLVVFPIKGRKWCFSRSVDPFAAQTPSGVTPTTVRGLWKKLSSESKPINANAELLVDFISDKMNKAWTGLEKAPEGSMKNKIHGLGLKLLARVKPSEIFLKSISKEVTSIQVSYPPSLDPRLVRRRLRHIAMSGTILHKKYLIGSVTLLPLTSAFMVLPLPNIPFFWVLFRTYSHWRALQGSEQLLKLLPNQTDDADERNNNKKKPQSPTCVLLPSEELCKLLGEASEEGLSEETIVEICKLFHLNKIDVLKYRNLLIYAPILSSVFFTGTSEKDLCYFETKLVQIFKFISPNTEDAKYVINVKQIAKVLQSQFVVGLGDKVSPTEIEEGMRVGVDRNKYQIQIPRPPKIDPSVTMMTVEEKPDVTYNDVGGCKEQIEKMREVVELPMLHPEKFVKLGIDPPKGLLCYGPPGTGKTLLARAVANRTDA
ncbi:hypothetical protein IGI04_018865 [Brassica rapa subsp. trilocularis]|uniref:ATPase AAA-type core domain-containing protein n=1 Tax=Brassica rapa subsp. trilocularis TaxID=1813537 RepID=A0ABQ7ME63_BRACM|nr:hypothetical protein IGI04_018865 [Brassica rapa subsp. trilocularis]